VSAEVIPESTPSVPIPSPVEKSAGHVIVCGLGGIGMRITEQLRRAQQAVTVLEEYADRTQLEVVIGWGVSTAPPFGTSAATLAAAGIRTARAVVCVLDDELKNLEISLVAREMSPSVRVVTQLGNQAIGHAMAERNGPGAVLDVASLATPAIVEACLSRRIHEVMIGEEAFLVARLPVDRSDSLRGQYGDLAPIAVVRQVGADADDTMLICPDRDFIVEPGDVAAMLGTPAEFKQHKVDLRDHADDPAPPRAASTPARAMAVLSGIAKDFDPFFYKAVAAVLSLLMVSTLLLWTSYNRPGMSALDAMYFSVETVATVGYGDFNFIDQEPWLRMWAIFLMIAGVTTIAMMMAFLSDMLISRRLNDSTGRRRARGMSRHVIVVGLGAFGIRVASALVQAGQRVVIVERDRENRFLSEAQDLRVPVIFGDATQRSTLDAARLGTASAVAVMTGNDMVNIETAIAVHDSFGSPFQPERIPVVTRVFDRALGRTTARRFGFQHVQSTEELTAPWFVGAALGLDVLGSFSIAQRTFMVSRLAIEPDSGLAGLTMDRLSANTRVVALVRHSSGLLEHPLHRITRFEAGDVAYLVGPYEELLGVLRQSRVR